MPVRIVDVADFGATFAAGRMTYRFSVPLPPITATENTLDIAVFDPEYHVDFRIAEGNPVAVGDGAWRADDRHRCWSADDWSLGAALSNRCWCTCPTMYLDGVTL
jgi:ABC-type uncharacterized transport system substrate-binding protein